MRPTPFRPALLALAWVGLLVAGSMGGGASAPNIPVTASSATLDVTSSGALSVNFSFTDPNGSTLRYAMDGNFTPLVTSLPINATTQSTILRQIGTLEATPLIGGFFGNRDGTVTSGEVTLFQSLLHQLTSGTGGLLPPGTFSVAAAANITLDGARASTSTFTSVSFGGAEGSDSSGDPIAIFTEFAYQFSISGSQHTVTLATGGAGLPTSILIPTVVSGVSLGTPTGTTITSVTGLSDVSIASDPWGWGSSRASGSYALAPNSTVQFHYQSSFPTGDVLIGASVAGVLAVLGAILLLRRRRRRVEPVPPPITLSGSS